ncbi:uncharacterized protein FA14DRAFT_178140 [Meira miltonrushii]|uniref:RING-type domain-containing protein n=1 Tax=Meira miltonrushii TaxID=1280837 RepID=A0A316VB41_9BASI|nr:uncharacterized protein FA14DRAFT_178140 [Meira miltonrushii]PWN34742.1 hypothetical protein FA14DRAFT_178140 [Meira miltonrushii]
MSSSKERARVEFNQADRQWIGLDSVQEKIDSMHDNVLIYLCQGFEGKMEVNDIEAAVLDTRAANFNVLSSGSVHGKHTAEEQLVVKQENGRKRKRTNDHNCEKCHNEVNEIYYRWLTQATQLIKRQLKKAPAVEAGKAAESSMASKSKGKGKQRAVSVEAQVDSDSTVNADEDSSADCPICCNEDIPPDDLTKCIVGHRFCKSCARRLAETEIGLQRTKFQCMHMEGCEATFSESEIKRFLDEKTFQLWSRMRTNEEVKSAKIDGLEACPFCFYAHIIYPEDRDKPFFCGNHECGKWSCLDCKKLSHEGKTCEEARQAKMTSEHKAEEKLAEALMRRCPKSGCNTVMVKDEGQRSCNKMSCVKCGTIMCYICRADITKAGYGHFDQNPGPPMPQQPSGSKAGKSAKKCPLWDDTKERHKTDINNARKEVGKLAPKVTEAEIEDERRRQQAFERRHGANAAHVPGEWGFMDDNEADAFIELFADRGRRLGRFRHGGHPPQRFGEGFARAMDRDLQEEADRREAERGGPEAIHLERERQLLERDREIRERERDRQDEPFVRERIGMLYPNPNLGHFDLFRDDPHDALAHQRRHGRAQQEPINAEAEGFARRLEVIRRTVDNIAGEIGRYRERWGERRRTEPIEVPTAGQARQGAVRAHRAVDAPHNALAIPALPRAGFVRADHPYALRQRLNAGQNKAQAPMLGAKKDNTQAKQENTTTKPDMKIRKVGTAWQWLERSATPKENSGTQIREDKGEGSSKSKAHAGPSRSANPGRSIDVIDLTMTSDEESEVEEVFGLIYL